MKIAVLFLFALAGFVSSQEVPEYEVLEDAVHHVTSKADFEAQLEATDKLVVVDFFATWCGPCKAIAPKIEKLAQELKGEVVFLKVDIDEVNKLAYRYQIHELPNFVFIKNKKALDRVVGADLPKVKETIKRHKDAIAEGLDEITPLSGAKDDADKVKSELIKMLQDSLHKTVEKIKTRIDDHHQKANDLIEKAHELAQRLKAHHADLGEKVRDSMKKLSGQAREHLRSILDSFKQREKRSLAVGEEKDIIHYTLFGEKCATPCVKIGKWSRNRCLLKNGKSEDCSSRTGYTTNDSRCKGPCIKKYGAYQCKETLMLSDSCSPVGHCMNFFDQKHYKGEKLRLCALDYNCVTLPDEWQVRVSSLNTSDYSFKFYDDVNCQGGEVHLHAHTFHLYGDDLTKLKHHYGNTWDKKVRSFEVYY